MKVIGIDMGHTLDGADYGAVGIRPESILTREVGNRVIQKLKKEGCTVIDCTLDHCNSLNQSLSHRVNKANLNKVDMYVSIHFNCFNGSAHGTEVFTYGGKELPQARAVLNNIEQLGYTNRCKDSRGNNLPLKNGSNLYVLRNSNMKSMLIEVCFCDNDMDMNIFNAENVANAIVKGLVGQTLATSTSNSTSNQSQSNLYGIVKANALNVRNGMSTSSSVIGMLKKGERVNIYKIEGEWVSIYYGQHGGYVSSQYLELHNITVNPKSKSKVENIPNIEENTNKTKIIGKPVLTKEQMAQYVLNNNPSPKIAVNIEELAEIFLQEGKIENIRGDIAFCQAIKETGFFKFGGQVLPGQNNYAGIGATNNSKIGKGAWFDTSLIGVRAQIQHLKAYATTEPLKQECVDPRFHLVSRGIAPNWEDLNGKWAVPGQGYGESILDIYNKILSIPKTKKEEVIEKNKEPDAYGIEKVVAYYGDVDLLAAVILSQKLGCALVKYSDINSVKAKKIIRVGGEHANYTGSDRFETFKSVANAL